ncbi:TetR/AcrR family transcriptional regulator [Bacillus sp. FJAT-42376]|uniref:TetR/AcrR family transcriptional regulator n=1 Tax=Bacillus sp. FJAT-42376 TaxID=2014076 RepID=UPI0013DE799E|nr:TetR/AcrR family transcriptional regulator [Bacillus sp. FJAT-42376]
MPKVNEEHLQKKKQEILAAAKRVCSTKPIYEVAMRDIVIESGMSQGGVYKYFSGIDDVFAALLNKESLSHSVKEKVDGLVKDEKEPMDKLEAFLLYIGEYIRESLTEHGSFFYELQAMYGKDPERFKKVKDQLDDVSNLQYIHGQFSAFLTSQIEKAVFHPRLPQEDIQSLIETYLSGMVHQPGVAQRHAEISRKIAILLSALKELLNSGM